MTKEKDEMHVSRVESQPLTETAELPQRPTVDVQPTAPERSDDMHQIRCEQLAVLLEIEAAVKHAKAAWLRKDQLAIADALDRAAEASARMPKDQPNSEYAIAT